MVVGIKKTEFNTNLLQCIPQTDNYAKYQFEMIHGTLTNPLGA